MAQKKIIADGDSWFDYPKFLLTGGGVVDHISRLTGWEIPNYAHAGDATVNMLGIKQRNQLENNLPGADILLFSGGGNDIAGDQFCIWLNDNTGAGVDDAINPRRLGAALDLIMASYDDLRAIRDAVSPNCWIVTHGYDFPVPDGRGICNLGPWLKPSLEHCGWHDPFQQSNIVAQVLKAFNDRLAGWSAARHIHVPTQGTLTPSDWGNEIHPNRTGYTKIARKFIEALKPLME